MSRRRLLILPLAAAAVLAPTQAWAYFSVSATGVVGKVSVNALGAPTASATQNLTAATITVSAKPTTGPTPSGYRVDRLGLNAATGVCTITGATGSCTDTNSSLVATSYKVYSTLNNWTAGSATTVTATILSTAFTVTAPSNATAGTQFNLTVTATTAAGLTDGLYTGTKTITITGAANSPNGNAPTLPITAFFTNGVATVPVILTNAAATTLTVTAIGHAGSSSSINVAPTSLRYALTGPASSTAGAAYTLTSISAKDFYGNLFTGTKTITWSGAGTVGTNAPVYPSGTVTFTNGVAGPISGFTFYKAENFNLTATTPGVTSGQTNVQVAPNSTAVLTWQSVSPTAGTVSTTCVGAATCSVTNLGQNGKVTATLLVTDSAGNPLNGASVSLTNGISTSGGGAGTLSANPVTSNTSGIATFTYTAPNNNGYVGPITATYGGGTATLNVNAK